MSMTPSSPTNGERTGPPDNAPVPPTLEFKRLSADCQRGAFRCGDRDIDNWFREDALNHHNELKFRVTTAHLPGEAKPVGFYAMVIHLESAAALQGQFSPKLFKGSFPTVLLSRVAIDGPLQRQGLGKVLMGSAISDFYDVAVRTGIFCMTLQAINQEAAKFYKELGFVEYAGRDAVTPKMILPARSVIEMIEG